MSSSRTGELNFVSMNAVVELVTISLVRQEEVDLEVSWAAVGKQIIFWVIWDWNFLAAVIGSRSGGADGNS